MGSRDINSYILTQAKRNPRLVNEIDKCTDDVRREAYTARGSILVSCQGRELYIGGLSNVVIFLLLSDVFIEREHTIPEHKRYY